MSPPLRKKPLAAAGLAFVSGVAVTTLFLFLVSDDPEFIVARRSAVYATGAAVSVYLAYSRLGPL